MAAELLVVHSDPRILDLFTRVFEGRRHHVHVAPTASRAMAELRTRDYDVILAGWEEAQSGGADLYRWALERKHYLRGRFVFLAEEIPEGFQDVVEGRCLVLHPEEIEEIVRVAEAALRRARHLAEIRISELELEWVTDDQPTMLLVDDEPAELMFMVRMFNDVGFAVTPAESGNAALAQLEVADFDVIVADWYMPDGSGAELYSYLVAERPDIVVRMVFISDTIPKDFHGRAPGRVLIPKGQDSPQLVQTVINIARRIRAGR